MEGKETVKEKEERLKLEAESKKIQEEMNLDVQLNEGWSSNGFHFNEQSSYNFCTLMNTVLNLGLAGLG